MSDQGKRAARRPWWVLGPGLVSSIVLSAVFALLASFRISEYVAEAQAIDLVFAIMGLVLVVAGVVSIVYYLRRGDQ